MRRNCVGGQCRSDYDASPKTRGRRILYYRFISRSVTTLQNRCATFFLVERRRHRRYDDGIGIGPMSASERPSYDPSGCVLETIIHFLRERRSNVSPPWSAACVSDRNILASVLPASVQIPRISDHRRRSTRYARSESK